MTNPITQQIFSDQAKTTLDLYTRESKRLQTSVGYLGKNRTITVYLTKLMNDFHKNGFPDESLQIESNLNKIALEYNLIKKIQIVGNGLLYQIKTCLEFPIDATNESQRVIAQRLAKKKIEITSFQNSLSCTIAKLAKVLNDAFYYKKNIKYGTSFSEKIPSLQYSYLEEALAEINGKQNEIPPYTNPTPFEIENQEFSPSPSVSYSDQIQHIVNLYDREVKKCKLCIESLGADRTILDQIAEEILAFHANNLDDEVINFENHLTHFISNYTNIVKSFEHAKSFLELINGTIQECSKPIIDNSTLQTLKKMNISCEKAEISSTALLFAVTDLKKRKIKIEALINTISEFMPKLEQSLDTACYTLKYVKNETTFFDLIPSRTKYYYLKQMLSILGNQTVRNPTNLALNPHPKEEPQDFNFQLPIANLNHAIWILNNEKKEVNNQLNTLQTEEPLPKSEPNKVDLIVESKTNNESKTQNWKTNSSVKATSTKVLPKKR